MKNYWHCILEVDIPDGEMPRGSDTPMRKAIHEGVVKVHVNSKVINIWSGWGLSKKGSKNLLIEACKGKNMISSKDIKRRDG